MGAGMLGASWAARAAGWGAGVGAGAIGAAFAAAAIILNDKGLEMLKWNTAYLKLNE